MTFSMRQQKLDRFCPGYKIVGLRLTKFPASPVALALAGVVVAGLCFNQCQCAARAHNTTTVSSASIHQSLLFCYRAP